METASIMEVPTEEVTVLGLEWNDVPIIVHEVNKKVTELQQLQARVANLEHNQLQIL